MSYKKHYSKWNEFAKLNEDPMGFVHDLAAAENVSATDALSKAGGREIKRAFAANADYSFLNTLDTVHWTDAYLVQDLMGKGKDELSTSMSLPEENLRDTGAGDIGLWIKGRITLATNDHGDLYSKHYKTYGVGDEGNEEEIAHRDMSSGRTKRPTVSKNYKRYSKLVRGDERAEALARDIPYVLDMSTWNPSERADTNEALVGNWKPIGLVIPDWADRGMGYILDGLGHVEGTEEDVKENVIGAVKNIMLQAIRFGVPIFDQEREVLWTPFYEENE